MQAITSKYLGPTNSKGSRIKAECTAKRRREALAELDAALARVGGAQ